MRRSALPYILVLAASTVGMPAVDPALLHMVMPEARVIAGADLRAARTSPFGLFLLDRGRTAEDPQFRRFLEATGFDPREDLYEVVLASTDDPEEHRGLILARGLFDVERISALASQHGMSASTYEGALVLTALPGERKDTPAEPGSLSFLNRSIAVAGDAASVRAAIDRYRRGGAPLHPALAARVMDLSRRYEFWSVSLAPAVEWRITPVPDQQLGDLLRNHPLQGIVETSGGVKLGPEIAVDAEVVARSDKDAAALADVVRFVAGMMAMNATDPKAAGAVKLLQSLKLVVEGARVKLSLRIPEADMEKVFLAAQASSRTSARRTLRHRRPQ
jgi:hypothetical protein